MANNFIHVELTTGDTKKAQQFYKKVFSWKLSDVKGMPYTMINTGSKKVGGGIQPKPMKDAPTAWMPYVEVDDVKKSMAKAAKAGAKVVVPYQPLPGMGAIGVFMDPTGAYIGVWAAAKLVKKSKR